MDDIQRAIEFFEREKLWRSAGISPMLGKKSVNLQYIETAISAMKELQKYRQIGTLEECREAREKQKAKPLEEKVNPNFPHLGKMFYCSCGVAYLDSGAKYCGNCGQRLREGKNNG